MCYKHNIRYLLRDDPMLREPVKTCQGPSSLNWKCSSRLATILRAEAHPSHLILAGLAVAKMENEVQLLEQAKN